MLGSRGVNMAAYCYRRQVLEDEGVLKYIDVGECQLDIFPFDTDILSLELENSFKVQFPRTINMRKRQKDRERSLVSRQKDRDRRHLLLTNYLSLSSCIMSLYI